MISKKQTWEQGQLSGIKRGNPTREEDTTAFLIASSSFCPLIPAALRTHVRKIEKKASNGFLSTPSAGWT